MVFVAAGAPPKNPDNVPGPIPEDADSLYTQKFDETSHNDKHIRHENQQEAKTKHGPGRTGS